MWSVHNGYSKGSWCLRSRTVPLVKEGFSNWLERCLFTNILTSTIICTSKLCQTMSRSKRKSEFVPSILELLGGNYVCGSVALGPSQRQHMPGFSWFQYNKRRPVAPFAVLKNKHFTPHRLSIPMSFHMVRGVITLKGQL